MRNVKGDTMSLKSTIPSLPVVLIGCQAAIRFSPGGMRGAGEYFLWRLYRFVHGGAVFGAARFVLHVTSISSHLFVC